MIKKFYNNKGVNMKKMLIPVFVFSAMVLIGCSSVSPVKGYAGTAKQAEEIASINYEGNTWTHHLLVFKLDGETRKNSDTYLWTFNSKPAGDLNLQLLPGYHELELGLIEPDGVKTLGIKCEAGKKYYLTPLNGSVNVNANEDGKMIPVKVSIKDVPFYKEPSESEAHATFIIKGTLYRIDGFPGKGATRFWFTEDKIRLKPGGHILEYVGTSENSFQLLVQKINFDFKSGKTYTFNFSPKKSESGSIDFNYMDTTIEEVR